MEDFTDYLDAHRGAIRGLQRKKEPSVSKEPPKKEPPKRELTPAERLQNEELKEKIRKYGDGRYYSLKKGGYVRAADGCAKRGKTRGRVI